MDRPVPQIVLREQRDRTITRLCEAFAQDRLEMAEFESRLDRAHRAVSPAELDVLTGDLPAPAAAGGTAPTPARDALARGGRAVREAVRDSRTFIAFMGGVERRGNWVPARRNVVIAIMGGAELDFREVDFPPGETEVFIFTMMGGVDIVVPPDLVVDASGLAIMGGFAHASPARRSNADAPVLRITGFCFMGGVDISVRHAGESPKDARIRAREDRHRLRDEQKRLRGRE
jgi:hypothetical protein